MKTIYVRTWEGFVKAIAKIRSEYGIFHRDLENGKVYEKTNLILFRGQASARWKLETTLERKTDERFHVLKYVDTATQHTNEIEAFTGVRWKVPDYPDLEKEISDKQGIFRAHLPAYGYLVYLRHHGFPSPLLDWTESPYIAAYFAFFNALSKENSTVYCYTERPEGKKGGTGRTPMISLNGPFVTTHKRHFAQKAWYTVATQWDYGDKQHYFCSHESVFDRDDPKQDLLFKIVIPVSQRIKALQQLNDYNINHFTLFQSEDSLIKALSMKQFDLGRA